ncbi:gamma-glutamyl-gamma-aminobutyrate hydrolase family protein [Streptococcus caprae]|uniref:Gamma-glutamyl-gamma-aminobutyrate hydrolase family protein n=1 Tax=Streptococcus caprae TaxID=1640501 RepID=A0ABV8CXS7_9STRE
MTQPIIGISANQKYDLAIDDVAWSYTPTGTIEGVKAAGGLPLILPINDETAAKVYVSMIDKLIITGGQNVEPKYYNEEPAAQERDYFEARDIFEMALVREALAQNKPIFTICRGTQLLNVVLGGSLHQDIMNHWQADNPDKTSHTIEVVPNSLLSQALKHSKAAINSFHRQALKDLSPKLKVTAWAEDQTIEAVESYDDSQRLLGVQWHPEFLWENNDDARAIFDYVVNEL